MVREELLHDGIDETCTLETAVVSTELFSAGTPVSCRRPSLSESLDKRLIAIIKALDR
jgi:hypothetical protein